MAKLKPFLTYEQQLDKLIDEKNLVIKDRRYAEDMLSQVGYFTFFDRKISSSSKENLAESSASF